MAVKQLHTDLGEVYRNRERLTMLTDHPNLVMLEWWDGKNGGFAVKIAFEYDG